MTRIIGFDPGLASTGWGVIDVESNRMSMVDFGTIVTRSSKPDSERLLVIFQETEAIIQKYKPFSSGIESLFFAKNVSSALPVAQARGVLLLCCARLGVLVGEYTPIQIKQAVVGSGRAEKSQVQSMVTLLLGLSDAGFTSHDADALAAAICHAHNGGSRCSTAFAAK